MATNPSLPPVPLGSEIVTVGATPVQIDTAHIVQSDAEHAGITVIEIKATAGTTTVTHRMTLGSPDEAFPASYDLSAAQADVALAKQRAAAIAEGRDRAAKLAAQLK